MFDKEIEALAKCTESIKDLDDDSRVRVIRYLIERFGIGGNQVASSIPVQNNPQKIASPHVTDESGSDIVDITEENNSEEYPTLGDLVIKDYPRNEVDWILCYAFYASNFGAQVFTKDAVIEKAKDINRFEGNARSNFGANFKGCIKKDWFKSVNDSNYILKSEGIRIAKELLQGKLAKKDSRPTRRKIVTEPKAVA